MINKALMVLLAGLALLVSCQARPSVELFATGLNQPRGMAFDEAGNLYVAEAGALAPGDAGPVAPIINRSSQVARIAPNGQVTTLLAGLPFTNYVAAGDIGATDVALLAGDLYILTGEGYDDQLSRAVLRLAPDGSPQPVASIRQFVEAIAPPDSRMSAGESYAANPYAMLATPDGQALYISDGASGRLLYLGLDGSMRMFAELPDNPPLTGLAFGPDGQLYVALLSALPLAPGNGAIWRVDPSGALAVAVSGLTLPIDVSFDAAGTMYVLEFGAVGPAARPYVAGSGRLLRIGPDGAPSVLLEQLNYPTAMVFSGKGDLYIAVNGAFTGPGQGAILRVPCYALGAPDTCLLQASP
jgi:DNA-binding beta-propeller fold protein YncE